MNAIRIAAHVNPQPTRPGDVWRVDVYPDYKLRFVDRASPTNANLYADPWVLRRQDVPSLSDTEWAADPWADQRADG